ncbi:hypothetical protein EC960427_3405B, partial [Escherichia coli 96.0427]
MLFECSSLKEDYE